MSELATSGPLLLALAVSALAGLVSFLSPCILPLVPGYVSYVTGLAGTDLAEARQRAMTRVLAGSALFVAGFTAVFTTLAFAVGGISQTLLLHRRTVEIAVGAGVIVLGLAFLGLVPGLQRTWRVPRLPSAGLVGAPVLGAVFALSWVPCLSPTLAAVLGLAYVEGSAGRGVLLAVAYCLGLGLPFLLFALGLRGALGMFAAVRRYGQWVTRAGGVLLLAVGVALVTGAWADFIIWLQVTVGPGEVGI